MQRWRDMVSNMPAAAATGQHTSSKASMIERANSGGTADPSCSSASNESSSAAPIPDSRNRSFQSVIRFEGHLSAASRAVFACCAACCHTLRHGHTLPLLVQIFPQNVSNFHMSRRLMIKHCSRWQSACRVDALGAVVGLAETVCAPASFRVEPKKRRVHRLHRRWAC